MLHVGKHFLMDQRRSATANGADDYSYRGSENQA
jgi:hypothetical protein